MFFTNIENKDHSDGVQIFERNFLSCVKINIRVSSTYKIQPFPQSTLLIFHFRNMTEKNT